ncbi:MAG: phosphohydrolase [Chloroflexus sp.]|uniref:HD family phosphohydrolase n=1 Tax=Chloroflexus sp. TaxID=1904827 RepID=UPI0021DD6735|nr:HDIG domain-containing metalloprotein [Chloroflexus sp.]GIV91113.1 MAG: phosphohydrolase [Chloroflexus sp.]
MKALLRYRPFRRLIHPPRLTLSRGQVRLSLAVLLLWAGIWAVSTFRLPGASGLQVGQPSPMSIVAPNEAIYTSEVLTAERRKQAENNPDNLVYFNDPQIPIEQRRNLFALLDMIGRIRNDPTLNEAARLRALQDLPSADVTLTTEHARLLLSLDDEEWSLLRTTILNLYDRAIERYDYAVDERALSQLRERWLGFWLATTNLDPVQRELAQTITAAFLRVNRTLDLAATEERRANAAAQVAPVEVKVLAGEMIIRAGEIVTPAHIEKLQATGAMPRPLGWSELLGYGLLATFLSAGLFGYLGVFQPSLLVQTRSLLTLIGIVVGTLLLARLTFLIYDARPVFFPLATLAVVTTVVFSGQLGFAVSLLAAIVIGVLEGNDLTLVVTLFASCTSAILLVRTADRLRSFLIAGLGITATIVGLEMTFWLSQQAIFSLSGFSGWMLTTSMSALTNGGLTTILSFGLFNVIARLAGQVTALQLMELAHPSRPLLRKLIREAPGTYYHSVAVGNLAEAAAEAIGADALLLRVAAYYHDIGKTIRPAFFTDNQMGRENVHDELDPYISAQIIIDHVREGIKMARAAGLPEQIIDFIATHHGTGLVRHFYQQALQRYDNVDERDFRYPGPRPQTREQAILMLADSVEATVRSKAQHGKLIATRNSEVGERSANGAVTLDELVQSIIDARVREGELNDAPLTMRELRQIKTVFVNNLQSIYHPRVDYAPQLIRT